MKHNFSRVNKAALKVLEENVKQALKDIQKECGWRDTRHRTLALLNVLSHFCAETINWDRELAQKLAYSIVEDCILHEHHIKH